MLTSLVPDEFQERDKDEGKEHNVYKNNFTFQLHKRMNCHYIMSGTCSAFFQQTKCLI